MRDYLLSCLVFVTACSKGDAQPNATAKPVEAPAAAPAPAAKPEVAKPAVKPAATPATFPRPKADSSKARELGMKVLTSIGSKPDSIPFELNRKFVSIQISPATGKKAAKAFCGDDDMKAWSALPKQIASRYGARIAGADPETIQCAAHDHLIFCELAPQDEHELEVTFAIAPESYGPVLAGVVERETWMIDPDSARYKADLAERDRELAKATLDDCFRPESSRGRE
jgi:hypothetical protein